MIRNSICRVMLTIALPLGAFAASPEDTRTNMVFKNPTPNDEFVLKFRRP
jgi:hypothetical protein